MPRAQQLNRDCACESAGSRELTAFYAGAPVFVSAAHRRQMQALIAAIHRVVAMPGWQSAVLGDASPVARHRSPALGVFAGFDFHVGAEGPKLIEINTNAGGAMLNAVADWRHPACCDARNPAVRLPASREQLEATFVAMFRNEWRLARDYQPLKTLAIVDDEPARQFLYPEFRLFETLFRAHGIDAFIADASELEYSGGRLRSGHRVIDLVYNRVTDFDLDEATHAALRDAWLDDAAVITPHPHVHALLADKRNLVRLTHEDFLKSIGAHADDIQALQVGIPSTREVQGCKDTWWQDRKGWFFKPTAGFASRGAYRGDKITRRAFAEVVQGDYVAQRFAAPGERLRQVAGTAQNFKVDLRHYVYDGATQLLAARLYQGQTTNFRTPGGGFSPVIELLDL